MRQRFGTSEQGRQADRRCRGAAGEQHRLRRRRVAAARCAFVRVAAGRLQCAGAALGMPTLKKKPGYAHPQSQQHLCERCRCQRFGRITYHYGVPGLPGADPTREVEVGTTFQCDKCGHKTSRYIDD
jgi:hypothetical protein